METIWFWIIRNINGILASIIATVIIGIIVFIVIRPMKFLLKKLIKFFKKKKNITKSLISYKNYFQHQKSQYKEIPFLKVREDINKKDIQTGNLKPLYRLKKLLKRKSCIPIIIGGSGGLGKSRLCYELARKNHSVYFVHWEAYKRDKSSLLSDLMKEKLKSKILVFEDAHEQIGLFLDFLKCVKTETCKVIVTTRYHKELEDELKRNKEYPEDIIILQNLTNASNILPSKVRWLKPDDRNRINEISEGIPQVAVEAYQYLKRRYQEGKGLDDFRKSIHTKVQLLDSVAKDIEEKVGIENKGVLSKMSLIRTIPEEHSIRNENFDFFQDMEKLGYIQRSDQILKITPDIVADHILIKSYFPNFQIHPDYESIIKEIDEEFIISVLRTIFVLESDYEDAFFTDLINKTLGILGDRNDLSHEDRVNIGINAFDIFKNFNRIEKNFGNFWGEIEKIKNVVVLNRLGIFLMNIGEWDKSLFCFQRANKGIKKDEESQIQAQIFNNLGLVHADKGDWDKAIEFFEKALEIFEKLGDVHGQAKTFGNLGAVYYRKGDWDKAIEFYEKDLEIFEKLGDVHGQAQTFNNLGLVHADKGDWDKAIEFYEKALEIFEKLGDVHGQAKTFGNLGLVHADKGDWDKAIEFFEKALEIFEKLGDVHGQAQTFNNLGTVYARKGDWDKAIEFFEKALEIFEKLGDVHGQAKTFNNLGTVYARKGDWDKAIEFYEKDLEISKKLGDVHGQAQTFGNLGLVHADKGDWDKAIEFFEKDLEISKKLGDVHGQAKTFGNLGLVHADKGDWDKAIEFHEKALEIYEKLNDTVNIKRTIDNLNNIKDK